MTSCEWMVFLNALAISLAKDKSVEELEFYALICSQLATSFAFLSSSPPGCIPRQKTTETPPPSDAAVLSV